MNEIKLPFPRRVLKSILQMAGGNTVTTISGFIASYFNAVLLGPTLLGTWSTAQIFLGYRAFFSFSLPFVMRRDFAMLRGEGKEDEAYKIAFLVFSYGLIITPVLSLALGTYATFFVEDFWFRISLYVIAAIFIIEIISGFGNILSKGINNYGIIGKASVIQAIIIVLTIPLIYVWGFAALLGSQFVIAVLIAWLYYWKKPVKYGWYWDWKLLKMMLITAFPLYLSDIAATVFASIDRVIIASMLSFEAVGLYALSKIVITPLNLLIPAAGIVIFTHLNERHGTSKEKNVVLKHMNVPQSVFCWLFPPLIGLGIILLPVVVPLLLPQYVDGILAAQISVIGVYFYALTNFSANALFVLDKQKISAMCFTIAGVINMAGSFLAAKLGYGIAGVAAATTCGFFIYNSMMMGFVYKYVGATFKEFFTTFLDRNLPIAVALLFSFLLIHYHDEFVGIFYLSNNWTELILPAMGYLLLVAPMVWKGISRLKVYVQPA
jgi:O-antigen/teichoic acid export membrane protein